MHKVQLSSKSLREQVRERIISWIVEQGTSPGERILSDHQLAKTCNIGVLTAHRVLSGMADEGILYREKGKGTYFKKLPSCFRRSRYGIVQHTKEALDPEININ